MKKGLKLESLDGVDTRPTLDRVKESIFSMLFDKTRGAKVLDLFAGSGAMGIEALSRGGESAVFVDKSEKACNVIRNNLKKSGFESVSTLMKMDSKQYLSFAGKNNMVFDIIFLDPPYSLGLLDETLKAIYDYGILAQDGIVVMEYDNNTDVDIRNYKLLKDKRYGRVCISMLESV